MTDAPDAVFAGAPRVLSLARVLAFSGGPLAAQDWPARNVHTDAGKARDAGFPEPVVAGFQAEGDIVRLLLGAFGAAWWQGGRLRVKFRQPMFVGDRIAARARVRERRRDGDETSVALEVWCENQRGERVVAGEAWCRIAGGTPAAGR